MIHCIHCGAAQATPSDRCTACGHPLQQREWLGLALDLSAPDQPQVTCRRCGSIHSMTECPLCGKPYDPEEAAVPPVPEHETIHCPHCGALLAQEAAFCSLCGKPLTKQPSVPPQPEGNRVEPGSPIVGGRITFDPGTAPPPRSQQSTAPKYDRVLPQQPDGGLTTAQYFWTLMLFAIPVVGLGFMLYWSFGSTASPARRRLARASLIKLGVGLTTGLAALLVIGVMLFQMARSYWRGWYGYDSFGGYGWYDEFEDSYGWPFDFFENFGKNQRIY